MSVTVAITNWNYGDYLNQAITSIYSQTRRPDHWYVVDDGSTDNSEEIYKELPPENLIRHGENRGACAAYNTAVDNCKTDFIIMLDADDYLPDNYVEEMVKTAEEKQVPWVYADSQMVDENGQFIMRYKYGNFDKAILASGNFINASAMIKTDLLREVGGFREVTLKDWDMWKRIAEKGHIAARCPNTVLMYRQHGISQMNGGRGKI